MCIISATELKKNLGKYLMIAQNEEVIVTKNGKVVVHLSGPKRDLPESFFKKYRGIAKEEDFNLSDPKIAGILGKLWDC